MVLLYLVLERFMNYTGLWMSVGNVMLASQLLKRQGLLDKIFAKKRFRICGNCGLFNVDFHHIEHCFKN